MSGMSFFFNFLGPSCAEEEHTTDQTLDRCVFNDAFNLYLYV